MLTIPESVKTLYKTDGVRKNFRAHFPGGEMADITNANIVRESLHFTESLCSQNNFRFGLAEASVLEFETVGVGNMYGMTINASIEIDVSSLTAAQIADIQAGTWDGELVAVSESDIGCSFFRIPLGVFRVEKCPRNHGAMTHRKVTAYSADQIEADPNGTIPGMPTELAQFPYYEADVAGVLAARNGEGLTKESSTNIGAKGTGEFFDSSGAEWGVVLRNISKYCTAWSVNSSDKICDFVRVPNYDQNAYYSQGEAIAAAIDAAGIDLTYGPDRKKKYSSNQEALLGQCPWYFFPVMEIGIDGEATGGGYSEDLGLFYEKLLPETFHGVPVFDKTSPSSADGRLFQLQGFSCRLVTAYCCYLDTSGLSEIAVQINNLDAGTSISATVPVLYNSGTFSVERYSGTATGMKIKIQNTGALPAKYYAKTSVGSTVTYKAATEKMYSYVNSVDYPKLVNGCYELNGQFAKTDRLGGFETVELSPGSYLSIGPGDYEDVWWDEYDVDPIGSVVVTVKGSGKANAQNTPSTISIGSGASVYDMSDNEAMEKLTANTLSDIRTLLRGSFKTNAARVGFTPIEMTMQGWPWMEAGDALRITAEDGTVVNTYALRVEMDGIQHLMATITAEGGEIVGET